MNQRRQTLKPFLRFIAAGTLLVWLSAVGLCQLHCCGDDDHAAAKKFVAHAGKSDSHDGDKDCHDDSACLTLKSALQNNNAIALGKPDFGLALSLNFLSTVTTVETSQSETFISRQPPDGNRVFKPEVSLGAAFYSLAPPVFA
jgi:hypothetical protein